MDAKQTDGSMPAKRGIVISPDLNLDVDSGTLSMPGSKYADERQDMRFYSLFWDEIDAPIGSEVRIDFAEDLQPDIAFLEQEGMLSRTVCNQDFQIRNIDHFRENINDVIEASYETFVGTYHRHCRETSAIWALASGSGQILLKNSDMEPERALLIKLARVIPVPNKDVPLEELLSFKQKRAPELLALRHHIESTYQEVVKAGDGPLGLAIQLEALNKAANDAVRASRSNRFPFSWRSIDLQATINIGSAAAAAAVYNSSDSLLLASSTLLASSLGVSVTSGFRGQTDNTHPFQYVVRYHHELFL